MGSNDKTAIFVDGAFFIKRSLRIFGSVAPEELARKLWSYSIRHIYPLRDEKSVDPLYQDRERRNFADFSYALDHLYRIFFYDCPPLQKSMHHPVTKKVINFSKSERGLWRLAFHEELRKKRKVALRLGNIDETNCAWTIKAEKVKELYTHKIQISDLGEDDYVLSVRQKGVDMRIGLDIASVAFKKQASRFILISGDSDFVPAAKLARREGIDFVLDSMRAPVKPDLYEHIEQDLLGVPLKPWRT
ncbi:MAG: NYN domain-containing protein [Selenomonadaceae bacterium]|nr:NYN domain-containing protein [Selenomonadaceae bacterium]